MKNIWIYLLVSFLLISNGFLLFRMSGKKNDTAASLLAEMRASDSGQLAMEKYYHTNNVMNSQLNNDIKLDDNLTVTGVDNKDVKLKTLVGNGPKLIVRSNESGCSVCIENEIQKVAKFAKIIGDSNIIVVANFTNVRKSVVFKQANNISLQTYVCKSVGLPYEKNNDKPFVFLLTPDMIAQNFYLPEVTDPEVAQGYYSAIYKRYFKEALHGNPPELPSL